MRDRLVKLLATGFGAGYAPKMPGTAGSILGIGVWFIIQLTGNSWAWILFAAGILPIIWIAGTAEKLFTQHDPQCVVIDEIVGMTVALAGICLLYTSDAADE